MEVIQIRTNRKHLRSEDYRREYFKYNHGILGLRLYACAYCGKLMHNKDKIVIDHIWAIRRIQNSNILKWHFKKYPKGVNDISNLTTACYHCNSKKSTKGGLWVLRGLYGSWFMPILRYGFYILFIIFIIKTIQYGR